LVRFRRRCVEFGASGPVPDYVHFHRVRFQCIFCYKGRVKVVYEGQVRTPCMYEGQARPKCVACGGAESDCPPLRGGPVRTPRTGDNAKAGVSGLQVLYRFPADSVSDPLSLFLA